MERLGILSFLHHGIRHILIAADSVGSRGFRSSLSKHLFVCSDRSSQVAQMSECGYFDVDQARLGKEMMGWHPIDGVFKEQSSAIEQMLLLPDEQLCCAIPILGL